MAGLVPAQGNRLNKPVPGFPQSLPGLSCAGLASPERSISTMNRSKDHKMHHKDTKFTKIRVNPMLMAFFGFFVSFVPLWCIFCFISAQSGCPREAFFALTERCLVAAQFVHPIGLCADHPRL
jgi:hypothetical protein